MRVVVHHNPRSGRGVATRLASRIVVALRDRGHRVKALEVGGPEPIDRDRLRDADAMIVIGGDGSVGYQAEVAIETGVPIYHAGTGNENLFARHFAMARDPVAVVRAVERRDTVMVDVARVGDRPVLLMVGTGCDAGVIRRIAQNRTRAIGHLAYVEPVIREGLNPSIRPVSVWVDGEPVIERGLGQLLIANCPKYAVNMDPARHARMDDGRLEVVFMPSRSSVVASAWLCAARLRLAERCPGWVRASGRVVRVAWADEPGPVQIDGEWAEHLNGDGFEVGVCAGVLPVLLPA